MIVVTATTVLLKVITPARVNVLVTMSLLVLGSEMDVKMTMNVTLIQVMIVAPLVIVAVCLLEETVDAVK